MKTKSFTLLMAMLLLSSTSLMAQARKTGSRPNIVSFVDDYFSEDDEDECDEFTHVLHDAWQKYKKHQPQDEGTEVMVDVANGYMRYQSLSTEEDLRLIIFEACYWNCADGKHKLVAYNTKSFEGDKCEPGQYDGLLFVLYNNATGQSTNVGTEDVGLDLGYGVDDPDRGYDSAKKSYYYVKPSGEKVYFLEDKEWEQWLHWVENNTTCVYASLPRQGKDIVLTRECGNRKSSTTWRWDGKKFHLGR